MQCDSALFLEPDRQGAIEILNRIGVGQEPYVIIDLHPWFVDASAESAAAMEGVAAFCRQVMQDKGLHVVFLPMDYRTDLDFRCGLMLRDILGHPTAFHLCPTDEFLMTPKTVKGLIGKANFVLSTRLHPIVFAIGSAAPLCGDIVPAVWQPV